MALTKVYFKIPGPSFTKWHKRNFKAPYLKRGRLFLGHSRPKFESLLPTKLRAIDRRCHMMSTNTLTFPAFLLRSLSLKMKWREGWQRRARRLLLLFRRMSAKREGGFRLQMFLGKLQLGLRSFKTIGEASKTAFTGGHILGRWWRSRTTTNFLQKVP